MNTPKYCNCYHKEVFVLGILLTFMVVAIIIIFEPIIEEYLKKFLRNF